MRNYRFFTFSEEVRYNQNEDFRSSVLTAMQRDGSNKHRTKQGDVKAFRLDVFDKDKASKLGWRVRP